MGNKRDVEIKIEEAIERKEYNCHLNPIDYDNVIPVDGKYPYLKKPLSLKIKRFSEKILIVKPFIFYINRIKYKTKFYNRKKLKGIDKAIVTCNHVDMFDCLVATKCLRPHKVKITAAPFNNQKGFLGEMMRAGDMIPFSEDFEGKKNFNKAIDSFIKKNNYIIFYPEASLWWHFKKPRPLKNGAYHYAYKYQIPVIPLMITFTKRDKIDKEGFNVDKFHIFVLDPIYPQEGLSKQENINYLRDEDMKQRIAKYEEFYQEKYIL